MALAVMSWMIAIPLLGISTGLRSMTPMAVACWFAYFGYLPVADTWAFWVANPVSVGVFTVLALGELIGDKLPKTPARVAPFPLVVRIVFGGVVGAIVAASLGDGRIEAILLGVLGAVFGSFAGFHVRQQCVRHMGWTDWRVAVVEDALALLASVFALRVVTG